MTTCTRCHRDDGKHDWVESDCILPHRRHSRATIGFCCEPCIDRWNEWLPEIVELHDKLPTVVALGSVPDAPSQHQDHRKPPASPAMMRLDAWALLHPELLNTRITDPDNPGRMKHTGMTGIPNVPEVVTNWASELFAALNWTSQPPDTVSGAAAVIKANVTVVAALPIVDTFDAELRWIRQALMRAHGIENPKPVGRCMTVVNGESCAGAVWRQPDAPPKCDTCGRTYSGSLDEMKIRLSDGRQTQ